MTGSGIPTSLGMRPRPIHGKRDLNALGSRVRIAARAGAAREGRSVRLIAEKPPQGRRGVSNIRCLRLSSLDDDEHNTTLGRVNDDDIVIDYDVAEALDLWNLSNDVVRECQQLRLARYLRAKRQAHAHVDFAIFRHAGIDEAHLPG